MQPLELLLQNPAWLFVGALGVMLLRAPDLANCWADRAVFALLTIVVLMRAVLLQKSLQPASQIFWVMCGMGLLVLVDLSSSPYNVQLWSVAAAKFFVPYTLFFLASLVFDSEQSLRSLEIFAIAALVYLSVTAIAYVVGFHFLVFPTFILDPNLGTHIERARGPFLQAQANGTALNVLGLVVLDTFQRRLRRGILMVSLLLLPFAILATKTRAVWLTFAISLLLLVRWTNTRSIRRWGLILLLVAGMSLIAIALRSLGGEGGFWERLSDEDTVEFRFSAYRAGWSMFLERPLAGWGASRMETELAQRIQGFRGDVFVVHNTYLEILLEYGLLGFVLYGSIWWKLLRLNKLKKSLDRPQSLLTSLHAILWPLILAVYFLSGCFVVMNYQFVNGLVFTLAGILAADHRKKLKGEAALVG